MSLFDSSTIYAFHDSIPPFRPLLTFSTLVLLPLLGVQITHARLLHRQHLPRPLRHDLVDANPQHSRLPLPDEKLDPLILGSALALLSHFAQLLARAVMHGVSRLEELLPVTLRPAHVDRRAHERQHQYQRDKVRVPEVDWVLVAGVGRVAAGVEALPVFPGGIGPDVRVGVFAPAAERARVGAASAASVHGGCCGGGLGSAAPACAEAVVGGAFDWV